MNIKRFLIFFLISLIVFSESPKAIPMSETYKQGIYTISQTSDFNATANLMTKNNVTSLIIFNTTGNEKFYKRFDTVDEVINLGFIKAGDSIVVVGGGEIAITFSK